MTKQDLGMSRPHGEPGLTSGLLALLVTADAPGGRKGDYNCEYNYQVGDLNTARSLLRDITLWSSRMKRDINRYKDVLLMLARNNAGR